MQSVDSDAVFLGLHHLSELLLDLGLRDAAQLRVDELDLLWTVSQSVHLRIACGQAWGSS